MRSIESVHLQNFQAHRDKLAEFSDFTGITGPTNHGKTAIIRGMFWCLYNSPSGTSFITRGQSTCCVTVRFSDGLIIKRTRGSKENSYNITYPDGQECYLEGFGSGPVDIVIEAHGMREIEMINGGEVLNFCKQLAPPFFIGESPTTQAIIIGLLGKTDIIDLSIKNTASDLRSKKAIAKEYKEELKSIKSELSELKGLSMLENALDFASVKLEKMEYINAKVENIKALVSKLEALELKRKCAIHILESVDDVSDCDALIECAISTRSRLHELQKLGSELGEQREKRKRCKQVIEKVDDEEADALILKVDEIITLSKNISSLYAKNRRLKELRSYRQQFECLPCESEIIETLSDIEKAIGIVDILARIKPINEKMKANTQRRERGRKVIASLQREQDDIEKEYKDGLGEHSSCPLCGTEINKNSIEI